MTKYQHQISKNIIDPKTWTHLDMGLETFSHISLKE
jgi:hypothetical protein